MALARRGRPRKAGPRTAKGRLIALPDRGNDVVQARAARFARFQDGKADQQVGDQIGRAWAVGLLDGQMCDGAILRDMGRRYGSLYWHEFAAMAPKIGALERRDRSAANDGGDDRPGDYFRLLDGLARQVGRPAVASMHGLCVDGWWFPDVDQPWVARLIATAVADAGGPAAQERALPADRARLNAAIETLVTMVEGRRDGARPPAGRTSD
ncbi:hypothetical protein [Sphingomonas sp.]|uniref:hypothetical protein n=1 Tax=Sphingomonas sp. TaxID=28214 RepID=UPI003B3BC1E4